MSKPLQVTFLGLSAIVHNFSLSLYRNNNAPAVIADIEYDDGERESLPVSVNIPNASDRFAGQEAPKFAAKNYSEREELYAELVKGGWLKPTGETIPSGYVDIPVCTLGENVIIKQITPATNV